MPKNIPQRSEVMTRAQLAERTMRLENVLRKCADELNESRTATLEAQMAWDDEVQRGDTYRRRALMLAEQCGILRGAMLAASIECNEAEEQLDALKRELSEALNSGDTYRRRALALRRQARIYRAAHAGNNDLAVALMPDRIEK